VVLSNLEVVNARWLPKTSISVSPTLASARCPDGAREYRGEEKQEECQDKAIAKTLSRNNLAIRKKSPDPQISEQPSEI
jgi:hypothetical protein